MKYKHKIIRLITLALVANIAFANFAFAQNSPATLPSTPVVPPGTNTTPTVPTQNPSNTNRIIINKAAWEAAQRDQAACMQFKDNIFNASAQAFKATWYDKGAVSQSNAAQAIQGNWGVGVNSTINAQVTGTKCYIISAWEGDWGADKTNVRTHISESLETTIKESAEGISSDSFADWKRKDDMERTKAGPVSALIGTVLDSLLSVFAVFLGALAALAGEIFTYAVSQSINVMVMPSAVDIGWSIMRDISNMFFILIMIIMALAAILRLEEYDYKHLMGEIVIMAILVNFSQVIAVTIINAVNFLTAVFWSDVGFTDIFATMMRVANPGNAILEGYAGGWSGALVSGLSKNVFMLVSLAVYVLLAALFVIRLVGLYVLVIFSPLAYVLDILPSTKHFGHEWWEKFVKYLIWAPVAVFMIRITMVIVRDTQFFPSDSAFTFIILSAFMVAAFMVAEEAGMVGSHQIVHGFEKAAHWAGHRGLHYAGRKYNEWSTHKFANPSAGEKLSKADRIKFALVNPVAAFKGWSARGEELAHHAQHIAQARGREAVDTIMSGTDSTMPWAQFADRAAVNDKLKSYLNMSKEQMMARAVEIEKLAGHEGETERLAMMKAAFSNGFQDDLMSMGHFAKQYADEDGSISSATAINRFLYGYLGNGHGGIGEQALTFMAVDLDEISRKTKHPEYMGHAYFDPDDKTFKRGMEVTGHKDLTRNGQNVEHGFEELKNTWQAKYMAGEWNKMVIRDRIAMAPHVLWTQSIPTDADGNLIDAAGNGIGDGFVKNQRYGRKNGELDEAQRAAFGLFMGTSGEIHHIQGRHANWAFPGHVDQNTGEYIAESKDAILSLQNAWAENALPIKAFYSVAIGKNPREHIKEVNGIKAAYYDDSGQKQYMDIGDPDSKMLITSVVSNEITTKEKIVESLKKEDIIAVDKVINDIVPDAYMGGIQAGQIAAVLNDRLTEMGHKISEALSSQLGNIAAEIGDKIQVETVSKYNPRSGVAGIDYTRADGTTRFSPADVRTLTKALSSAFSSGIAKVRVQGMDMRDTRPDGGRDHALRAVTDSFRQELDGRNPDGNYRYPDSVRSVTDAELVKLARESMP